MMLKDNRLLAYGSREAPRLISSDNQNIQLVVCCDHVFALYGLTTKELRKSIHVYTFIHFRNIVNDFNSPKEKISFYFISA